MLLIGDQAWPFPIPLVREGGAWRFATEQGVEEILNRRIGAQRAQRHRRAARLRRRAARVRIARPQRRRRAPVRAEAGQQRRASSTACTGPPTPARARKRSPFGPLIAESAAYLAGHKKGDPYRGYHFRILTRQGKNAPGGAYSYVINGRMIAGFAMVAYPAEYGDSGVMTFIVNDNGKVFEKDLGKNTAAIAEKMTVVRSRTRLEADVALTPHLPFPPSPFSRTSE